MSKVVRSVKNVTKGYTTAQIKVRNATSNDHWGPVGADMAEIAQMTYADSSTFYEIMDILDKRLNDKGKNWRHVLKSLKVLDYCLHEGSELVVTWARKNVYIIKTLREFQHVDEDGRDVGQNIRVSAKELTSLILDEERLRAERHDRKSWKSRVTGIDEFGPEPREPPRRRRERNGDDDDDLEMRLAIEASKNEAEEEARRRNREAGKTVEDDDLARAIKLSEEEAELRRKELEEANANSLFDDTPAPRPNIAQPTGWNQGYQQQPTVDWFGNVIDPQQTQNTGFYQNGFGSGFPQQAQYQTGMPTSFTPGMMQPQQTAFPNPSPFGMQQPQQQANGFDALNPGSNNPWATKQAHTTDSIRPTPTGSNNPFAPTISASPFARPKSAGTSRMPSSLSTLSESQPSAFPNPILNYQSPISPASQSQPLLQPQPLQQQQQNQKPLDPHHARLNALLATSDGQDTFGNVGETRIPAQHTAPGTFVNSAGAGAARLMQQNTSNPFAMGTQFTGMPPVQTAWATKPAQTGPVGAFGGQQQYQQQQQGNPFGRGGGGTGNLIDL